MRIGELETVYAVANEIRHCANIVASTMQTMQRAQEMERKYEGYVNHRDYCEMIMESEHGVFIEVRVTRVGTER